MYFERKKDNGGIKSVLLCFLKNYFKLLFFLHKRLFGVLARILSAKSTLSIKVNLLSIERNDWVKNVTAIFFMVIKTYQYTVYQVPWIGKETCSLCMWDINHTMRFGD